MKTCKEAVIVAYGRSAVCKAKKGSFANTHPVEFAAQTLQGVLAQIPELSPEEIEDLVVGCATPVHQAGYNMARLIVQRAGLPDSVCAQTVNRFCSSGLQTIATCSNAIVAGQAEVMVAGGVETMSMTFGQDKVEYGDPWLREHNEGAYMAMGLTAENVAARYNVTRMEMDQMAVESHRKALEAQEKGLLGRSVVPVTVLDAEGARKVVTEDEGIRPGTNLESLAGLKPCFKEGGTVTAATSSQTSDGAAFVVLMSAEKAEALGLKPLARLVGFAVAGCDAAYMGLGPIYAVPKVMEKTGLTVKDMDVIELNEAFAAQAIPCIRELGLPAEKVNPWGGAIALGHPMGATGGVLACKALDYLRESGGRYALVTMCIGGGMGAAGVLERIK